MSQHPSSDSMHAAYVNPESSPKNSRVDEPCQMINLSDLVLDIAQISMVPAPAQKETSASVSKHVQDIIPNKKYASKKTCIAASEVSLDNVSFYLAENAERWQYVNQRRISLERDLSKDASKC